MNSKTIHLSILALLFWASTIHAQSFTPIIINGQVFFKTEMETSAGPVFSEVTVANFEKIDGVLYNRVFLKKGFEPDVFVAYVREDPGTGRLYYRALDNDTDILVYDISLEVGDVINLPARWCDGLSTDDAMVTEVIEEEGRREVVFNRSVGEDDICEPLRFIEGVGPAASVIFPYFQNALVENGAALRLCHAAHEAVAYYPFDSNTDLCGLDITSTSEASVQTLNVFPNPAYASIQIPVEQIESITVYNTLGQMLINKTQITSQNLDISSLNKGYYQLLVKDKNKQVYSARFVKL